MSILAMTLTFLHLGNATTYLRKMLLGILLFVIAAFSCCTKEITIIAPLLLMLVDWFFIAHGSWDSFKSRLLLHIALFSLVIGLYIKFLKPAFFTDILGLKMTVKNNIGNVITHNPQEMIRPWPFFISQFKVILHYVWIFLWPLGISVEYDWTLCRSIFALDCFFPFPDPYRVGPRCISHALYTTHTCHRIRCLLVFYMHSPALEHYTVTRTACGL